MPDRRRAIDHVHLDEVLMPWATTATIVGNPSCDSETVSPASFTIRQRQEGFAGVLNAVTCMVGCRLPATAAALAAARARRLGDLDLHRWSSSSPLHFLPAASAFGEAEAARAAGFPVHHHRG